MKLSLEKQILGFAFLTLLVTIFVIAGLDILAFRRDYNQSLILRSLSLANTLKNSVEKVAALGIDIRNMDGIQERCSEVVLENPEISYCMITDSRGKPLYFNDPIFSRLWTEKSLQEMATLSNRQTSLVPIDGATYYNTITRIISPDAITIGYVLVGFDSTVINDKLYAMILRTLGVLVLALIISFTLVLLFARRNITQPVSRLLAGVRTISEGDLSSPIQDIAVREFNELATSINAMSESLKVRNAEIRRNYDALERTHHDLNLSYRRLEELSSDLERSEELYKSLLENASDAIFVMDNNEVVTLVNKMAEEFFGYSVKEVAGLPLTRLLLLLGVENIPHIHSIFRLALAGTPQEEEFHFISKGGVHLIGLVHVKSVKSGESTLVQAIVRDVTRERHILANLEKSAADLARLNSMKDSFIGLASHELKTPLTVIMGYSELIVTDMAELLEPTVKEMVENILRASHRLDTIVRDMIDVTMIDQRRLELRLKEVPLNSLVETAAADLKLFTTVRNQRILLDLDDNLPLVKADPDRLIQLFTNVIGNAIKFTPDGGSISVSTRLRTRTPSQHGSTSPVAGSGNVFVEVTVADTGIGIDGEDIQKIFDKFYEVGNIDHHTSGKTAFNAKGAGLGLAIAKGITDMHGGSIWAESPGYDPQHNPGSIFHILLPLEPDPAGASRNYLEVLS
jgi:PAS domain S-box-containing protein